MGDDDTRVRELRDMGNALREKGVFEAVLMLRHPEIPWRHPIGMTVEGRAPGLACRLCIARNGFRADNGQIFADVEAFAWHLIEEHPT